MASSIEVAGPGPGPTPHNGDLSPSSVSAAGSPNTVNMKRQVGLLSGTCLVVGTMIGSGIFVSPGGVISQSGSVYTSLLVWLGGGMLALLSAVTYTELGTMIPESGGEYPYLYRGLGPIMGFLYAWMSVLVIKPAQAAIITKTFAKYVVQPFAEGYDQTDPNVAENVWRVEVAVNMITIIVICFINCWSVSLATKIQNTLAFTKLGAIFLIIAGGFYNIVFEGQTQYLSRGFDPLPGMPANLGTVALAFYSSLWSYDGWNQLNFITEEIKKPKRNLPLTIAIGIPGVTLLYFLVNVSYLTVLSPHEVATSNTVALTWTEDMMFKASGTHDYTRFAVWLVTASVAMSTFGAANGSVFCAGRLAFAASRDGHLPIFLSMVHKSRLTPAPSIIFSTVVALAMVVASDIGALIDFFSFTAWIFYGGCFLSLIVLRFTEPKTERPIKIWFVIPALLVVASAYLVLAPIINKPELEYLYVLIFLFSGLFVYLPFVYFKLRLPGMDSFNGWSMRTFNLAKSDKEMVFLNEETPLRMENARPNDDAGARRTS